MSSRGRRAPPSDTDRCSLWSGVHQPARLSESDVRRPWIQPTNPPGAKSDYGICSLLMWPTLTSGLLSSLISPLKWFTNQVPENVLSMPMTPRLCMLTNEGSGAQRLGQPLHGRKLISLGSQPALWGPNQAAVPGDTHFLSNCSAVTLSLRRNLDDCPKLNIIRTATV